MTIIETFMERHASLAEASVIDRPDLRDLIEEERGLTCGVYGCGRAALHRMFSPSDGEYTQANAVISLLRGDMVGHLRCAACYHDEDTLIVEHLCPCSEIATLDVRVTGEMYRIIRRWFSPDLWAELSGPRYSTYRMCAACATETPSSGCIPSEGSPPRARRPGRVEHPVQQGQGGRRSRLGAIQGPHAAEARSGRHLHGPVADSC